MIDFVPIRRGHFRLESGMHAAVWLELDGLFAEPQRIAPMVDGLAARLRKYDFSAICGAMLGGAFLGQLLAHAMGRQFWFTERLMSGQSVSYVLPGAFATPARGARVAVVDDIMSAGSAMRGTYQALVSHGAHPVVIGAFMILGSVGEEFFNKLGIPVEALAREPFDLWQPSACRLCLNGVPLESTSGTP